MVPRPMLSVRNSKQNLIYLLFAQLGLTEFLYKPGILLNLECSKYLL